MGFDLMEWCNKNQGICIFILALVVLYATGYLNKILNMCGLEGFDVGVMADPTGESGVVAQSL